MNLNLFMLYFGPMKLFLNKVTVQLKNIQGLLNFFCNIKEDIRYRKTTDRSGGPKIGYYLFSLPAGVY